MKTVQLIKEKDIGKLHCIKVQEMNYLRQIIFRKRHKNSAEIKRKTRKVHKYYKLLDSHKLFNKSVEYYALNHSVTFKKDITFLFGI